MVKKVQRAWDWARPAEIAESYDHVPAPDERVRPLLNDELDPTMPNPTLTILRMALHDPHSPAACGACIIACLDLVSGPDEHHNDQVMRYNHHDVLNACMNFLSCPRTPEQYSDADKSIRECKCMNDNSPLFDLLFSQCYPAAAGRRLRNRLNLPSNDSFTDKDSGRAPSTSKPSLLDTSDRDPLFDFRGHLTESEAVDELEYEEACLRGEVGEFVDLLHIFNIGRSTRSLSDVLSRIADCIWTAIQPRHDRDDLHKPRASPHTGERVMWPPGAAELLPYQATPTIQGLGFAAHKTQSWSILGIAGVILDIISGPTQTAFAKCPYFPGAFVTIGVQGGERFRGLVMRSLRGEMVDDEAALLLVDLSRLSLLSHALADLSPVGLRHLNAASIDQAGVADALHVCNYLLCAWGLFSMVLLPNAPSSVQDIATRTAEYFLRLAASLHNVMHSTSPPPPLLSPSALNRDIVRADGLRALATPMQQLELHFTVIQVSAALAATRDNVVGAAFSIFFRLCWRRQCWGPRCDKTRALVPGGFKRCGQCWHVKYCSRECQRTAWREEHKDICAVIRTLGDRLEVAHEPLEPYNIEQFKQSCVRNWSAVADDLEKLTRHFAPLLETSM